MVAAVVGLVLVVALAGACGRGGTGAGPAAATTTSPARRCAADDGLVEVAVDVPAAAPAGERVWATLTVRNVGDKTVWWQAGGGAAPADAWITAAGARTEPGGPWSGVRADLADSVPRGAVELPFLDEQHVGLLTVFRTSDSRMTPLAAGERSTMRVAADVRLPPSAPASWLVRAIARFYDAPGDYGGDVSVGPRAAVVAECPIAITDRPTEAPDAAVAAFAADGRLHAFVAGTTVAGVDNSWAVHLAWWARAWELTVTPMFSDDPRGQSRYRLRARGRDVIDARRIWWDQAPADDPAGAHFPGAPPDDVE